MIFPEHCKHVGYASASPCGDRVYFLSRYLVVDTGSGHELREVTLDPSGKGMMRQIVTSRVLARPSEVFWHPEKVNLHDRTLLVRLASENRYRCTVFSGLDEHMTFVLDPDFDSFLKVHVYDVTPPRPSLSATIRELEAAGLFGELSVIFCHHVRDISKIPADIYPCRAAGFARTLDADPVHDGERVAGCLTGLQLCAECGGKNIRLENICPLECVQHEPFIARCCRSEREGICTWNNRFGAVVHWGAGPAAIARSVTELVNRWRTK